MKKNNISYREPESEYKDSFKNNFLDLLDKITLKDVILITVSLSLGLFLGIIIGGFRP